MQYALPYLLLTILLGLLALMYQRLDESMRFRMMLPCFFIMAAFFALRGYVGDDWVGYHPAYTRGLITDVHFDIWNSHGWRFEPGFTILLLCCKWVAGPDGYLFFQGVVTLVQLVLLFRFLLKFAPNLPLGLYLFLAMGGFIMLINTMRNTIALMLCLNALPYLIDRKPLKYFALCAFACLFHASSIIFFPLYFILHRNYGRWFFLTLFVIGNCIVLFHIPVISGGIRFIAGIIGGKLDMMVNAYIDDTNMSSKAFVISIGYLERLFTGTLLYIFYDRLVAMRKHNIVFVNAFIFFFFIYFFFSEIYEVGRRLADLFIYCYWILLYDFFRCFKLRSNKILYATFIGLYCSLKVFGVTGYPNTKYQNILFYHTRYEVRLSEHPFDMKEVHDSQ